MAVYHLKASIGSRGGGQSAAAKNAYICREGRYAGDADELLYREDGNMPQWAQDEPGHYWQAADDGERANGSLYREVQFALPQELSEAEQVDLARGFAKSLTTNGEKLPYTLAVHRGDGENPHAHLVISERVNDGQARTPETWFKRHNRQSPEKGGARKSRAAMPREWLTNTRQDWERRANEALERSGSQERIDSRSWADRREDAMKRGDLEEAARCSKQAQRPLGTARASAPRREGAERPAGAGRERGSGGGTGTRAPARSPGRRRRSSGSSRSFGASDRRLAGWRSGSWSWRRSPWRSSAARRSASGRSDQRRRSRSRIPSRSCFARGSGSGSSKTRPTKAGPGGGQIEMEREAQQASNALWERVCKLRLGRTVASTSAENPNSNASRDGIEGG